MNCNFITNRNTAFIFVFEVLQLNIFVFLYYIYFVLKVLRVEKTIDMNPILKDYNIILETLT